MKDCNACGKCCIKYGGGQLAASHGDLEIWGSFGPDIDAYVIDGKIWFDPQSKSLLDRCPWLKVDPLTPSRYLCEVYADRPEHCRAYPMTLTDMLNDECEMLESSDLKNLKQAEIDLQKIS